MSKKKSGGSSKGQLKGSLQGQLKGLGLATGKQTRKAQKGIHRQSMRVKHGQDVDESKLAAEQALTEKQSRDREQNLALNQAAQTKALQAQIKQLIELNNQRALGEVPYNFTDGKIIKKIHITESNRAQLVNGVLAIVKIGDAYALVPEQVARKIIARLPERAEEFVLHLNDKSSEIIDEDDPYKDFPIPDDLDW